MWWIRDHYTIMERKLLLTLADRNYLDQAKQLFSSVYFNAGWKWDYMLLSYQVPAEELRWFKDRGILIKECEEIVDGPMEGYPPVVFSKCFMFTPEFKQWTHIVYLDADIIVRASLDNLANVRGFSAVEDAVDLQGQARDGGVSLTGRAFCSGVMAFNTKIIKNNTFEGLKDLCQRYQKISAWGEQLAFNLYFYKKWRKLPIVYGLFICQQKNAYGISLNKIRSIILHFVSGDKPWDRNNYFYDEWKDNLDRADRIDLRNRPVGKRWCRFSLIKSTIYYKYRFLVYNVVNRHLGFLGLFLRKYKKSIQIMCKHEK
jgi:lipopolysaccharide biosynthesis glycosyltransferase